MANEIQTARSKVKGKLDIASGNTDFDAILLECLEQAIPRLAPFVQYSIAADESVMTVLVFLPQLQRTN